MKPIREILNYNFISDDIGDENFPLLFQYKRRDSIFAFVYEKDGEIFAIRDHLGIVPLYYRCVNNELHFSTNLTDLLLPNDEIDIQGLKYLLAFGTPRLFPLIKGLKIVDPGTVLKFDHISKNPTVIYKYKIKPAKISNFVSLKKIIKQLDSLLYQAIKRAVKNDEVGLYLSGGMDSSLIGFYLKKLGVQINAYTSASEGAESDDAVFSAINAKFLNIKKHFTDTLECQNVNDLVALITKIYSIPHGTTVSLGIASLWENTPISKEKQIFFGQNSDTMSCSVGIQVRMCFRRFIPKIIRKRLKITYNNKVYNLPYDNILNNYIFLRSQGLVGEYKLINEICDVNCLSNYQLMSIAGMYFGHVPHDGEDLSQPAINKNILISNPYYDMDLIEYNLGIPFRHRFAFIIYLRKKILFLFLKPVFKKRAIKKLALKYFPKKLVHKKKGFSISLNNKRSFSLDLLPASIMGIDLDNIHSRISSAVFRQWCIQNNLKIDEL